MSFLCFVCILFAKKRPKVKTKGMHDFSDEEEENNAQTPEPANDFEQ